MSTARLVVAAHSTTSAGIGHRMWFSFFPAQQSLFAEVQVLVLFHCFFFNVFCWFSNACGVSADPAKWSSHHIALWLDWAVDEFSLDPVNTTQFQINGAKLCSLSKDEFLDLAPPYTGDVLYSHLCLLRARNGKRIC